MSDTRVFIKFDSNLKSTITPDLNQARKAYQEFSNTSVTENGKVVKSHQDSAKKITEAQRNQIQEGARLFRNFDQLRTETASMTTKKLVSFENDLIIERRRAHDQSIQLATSEARTRASIAEKQMKEEIASLRILANQRAEVQQGGIGALVGQLGIGRNLVGVGGALASGDVLGAVGAAGGIAALGIATKEFWSAGEKAVQILQQERLAFEAAGKSGEGLNAEMKRSEELADSLSSRWNVSSDRVRQLTGYIAQQGGVLGQRNSDVVKMGIAVEELSKSWEGGSITAEQFAKILARDPEAEPWVGRLGMSWKALGDAMKGAGNVEEETTIAMQFLAPKMKELDERANSNEQATHKAAIAWEEVKRQVGVDFVKAAGGGLSALSSLSGGALSNTKVLSVLTIGIGGLTTATLSYIAVKKILHLLDLEGIKDSAARVLGITAETTATEGAAAATVTWGAVLGTVAAPIAIVVGGISAIAFAIHEHDKAIDDNIEKLHEQNAKYAEQIASQQGLTRGTKEWDDAVRQLNSDLDSVPVHVARSTEHGEAAEVANKKKQIDALKGSLDPMASAFAKRLQGIDFKPVSEESLDKYNTRIDKLRSDSDEAAKRVTQIDGQLRTATGQRSTDLRAERDKLRGQMREDAKLLDEYNKTLKKERIGAGLDDPDKTAAGKVVDPFKKTAAQEQFEHYLGLQKSAREQDEKDRQALAYDQDQKDVKQEQERIAKKDALQKLHETQAVEIEKSLRDKQAALITDKYKRETEQAKNWYKDEFERINKNITDEDQKNKSILLAQEELGQKFLNIQAEKGAAYEKEKGGLNEVFNVIEKINNGMKDGTDAARNWGVVVGAVLAAIIQEVGGGDKKKKAIPSLIDYADTPGTLDSIPGTIKMPNGQYVVSGHPKDRLVKGYTGGGAVESTGVARKPIHNPNEWYADGHWYFKRGSEYYRREGNEWINVPEIQAISAGIGREDSTVSQTKSRSPLERLSAAIGTSKAGHGISSFLSGFTGVGPSEEAQKNLDALTGVRGAGLSKLGTAVGFAHGATEIAEHVAEHGIGALLKGFHSVEAAHTALHAKELTGYEDGGQVISDIATGQDPTKKPGITTAQIGGAITQVLPDVMSALAYKEPPAQYNWNGSKKQPPKHSEALGILRSIAPVAANLLIPGSGALVGPLMDQFGVNANEQKKNLLDPKGLFGMSSGLMGGLTQLGQTAATGGLGGGILLDGGGFTGWRTGNKKNAAGIVHEGEYVFSADATHSIGVGNLDRWHKAARGYESGGYVSNYYPYKTPPQHTAPHVDVAPIVHAVNQMHSTLSGKNFSITTGDVQTSSLVGQQQISLISL